MAQRLDLSDFVIHGFLDLVEQVVVVHVCFEGGVAALGDFLAQGQDVVLDCALEVEVEEVCGRVAGCGVLEEAVARFLRRGSHLTAREVGAVGHGDNEFVILAFRVDGCAGDDANLVPKVIVSLDCLLEFIEFLRR